MRAEQRGERILNTTTAINAENGRRWRPAPAIHVSVFLHAAAAVWLAAYPPAWPWVLGVVGANHIALFCAALCPRGRLLGPNLVRLPASAARRREISLTFDDGPDPAVTPRVLELLDRYQAKASFFCIGENAAAQPELVPQEVAEQQTRLDLALIGAAVDRHLHTLFVAHAEPLARSAARATARRVSTAARWR